MDTQNKNKIPGEQNIRIVPEQMEVPAPAPDQIARCRASFSTLKQADLIQIAAGMRVHLDLIMAYLNHTARAVQELVPQVQRLADAGFQANLPISIEHLKAEALADPTSILRPPGQQNAEIKT